MYLGLGLRGRARFSAGEHAVVVLGPPRSGKTSAVIVPSVLVHTGPVVSTSTKADVLAATAGARSEVGTVWEFSPCQAGRERLGAQVLRHMSTSVGGARLAAGRWGAQVLGHKGA